MFVDAHHMFFWLRIGPTKIERCLGELQELDWNAADFGSANGYTLVSSFCFPVVCSVPSSAFLPFSASLHYCLFGSKVIGQRFFDRRSDNF